ncbi:hypothetical protein PENTCL1PPCAC_6197, partial [Pristionchus entomophagus]
ELWSYRLIQRILFVLWILTILECIPLIYPFVGDHYEFLSPIRRVGVGLVVASDLANLIYQVIGNDSSSLPIMESIQMDAFGRVLNSIT